MRGIDGDVHPIIDMETLEQHVRVVDDVKAEKQASRLSKERWSDNDVRREACCRLTPAMAMSVKRENGMNRPTIPVNCFATVWVRIGSEGGEARPNSRRRRGAPRTNTVPCY